MFNLRPWVCRFTVDVHTADLIRGRTPHVDVDDLCAVIDVVARRIGQHLRVVTGDLHGDRRGFAVVVHAQARLARVPQFRIGDGHFRDREPRTQLFAELPERLVGHAGHGREDQVRDDGMRADVHGRIVVGEAAD